MNAKIKKYVVPNLPYLFIFWFFCKLGEAYRLAAGADFGAKLIGMAEAGFADDSALSNAHYILRDKGIELKLV